MTQAYKNGHVKNVENQRIIRNFKEKLAAEFQKAVKLVYLTHPVGPLKAVKFQRIWQSMLEIYLKCQACDYPQKISKTMHAVRCWSVRKAIKAEMIALSLI
jgi:hypothetical protein